MPDLKNRIKKVFQGVVVSAAMDKTVMVLVKRTVRNPKYEKFLHRRKKFMAHDEKDQCQVGDRVEIIETRPLSRHKRWRVKRILEKTKMAPEKVTGNDPE